MKKYFALFLCSVYLISMPAIGQSILAETLKKMEQLESPILSEASVIRPVYSENGMVSTSSEIATNIAVEVLNRGGNAVDAAIATAFTMAVAVPRAGNIGGGGFMLVYDAKTKKTRAIDYREEAPAAASENMYIDADGNVDTKLARHSYLSAGVPGTVKGMELAYRLYATKDWQELLQPAIHLADEGLIVNKYLANSLKKKYKHLTKSSPAANVFYKSGGFYEVGETLYQKDLAKTLRIISKNGADGFYKGEVASKIALAMKENGGLITMKDLADYKARLREPVSGYYKGYKVVSMPPPSSGGVHLIQMLKILDGFDIEKWGFGSSKTMHVMAEAMRLAYADRSKYLGDPDFIDIPVKQIISDLYSKRLQKSISLGSATPSELIEPSKFMPKESPQTTHFTIVDKFGNVVTNTYTLNFSYGNGHMIAGTGILLNNEMDDFAAKVNVKNAYGLIGGAANKIEPKKRPLSSMTPTIIFDKNDKFYMSLGSPGGSRIITTVLQVILNVIDHKMNLAEAVTAPRMHHQWYPDKIRLEKGFSPDTIELLELKGHKISIERPMGAVMAVLKNKFGYIGYADTRRGSSLAKGGFDKNEESYKQRIDPLLMELIEDQVYEIEKHDEVKTFIKPTPASAVDKIVLIPNDFNKINRQLQSVNPNQKSEKKEKAVGISKSYRSMITPISTNKPVP